MRNMSTNQKVVLKSHYGYEIDEVRIMGKDRFLVAHTSDTLILGDMGSCKLTEVTLGMLMPRTSLPLTLTPQWGTAD